MFVVCDARLLCGVESARLHLRGDAVTLPEALLALAKGPSPRCASIFVHLVVYLADMVDRGAWVQGAPTSVLDAPMPQGARKRRRMPRTTRDVVAAMAADGGLARSGNKVLLVMARKHGWMKDSRPRLGGAVTRERCARYWACVRKKLKHVKKQHWTLVWDGTRAGRKDLLIGCLWSRELSLACWLPPQAPGIPP